MAKIRIFCSWSFLTYGCFNDAFMIFKAWNCLSNYEEKAKYGLKQCSTMWKSLKKLPTRFEFYEFHIYLNIWGKSRKYLHVWFQGYTNESNIFKGFLKDAWRVILQGITQELRVLQGYFKDAVMILQRCCKDSSKMLQG